MLTPICFLPLSLSLSILRPAKLVLPAIFGLALMCSAALSAASERLVLGVSPWTHQNLLFKWAKPIMAHIETKSGQRVKIGSAPDFPRYFKKAAGGEFDSFIAPVTFSLYLTRHRGFKPLLWVRVGYSPLLVCNRDAQINDLNGIAGKSVLFPSEISSTTLVMEHDIRQAGLRVQSEYEQNQWTVIERLLSGDVQCAALLSNLYESKSEKFKTRFNVVYRNPLSLDAMILAAPKTPPEAVEAFVTLADGFTDPGSIIKRFDTVTDAELKQVYQSLAPAIGKLETLLQQLAILPAE